VVDANPGDLDTARTRKANAEAELAEIEVAKARGEVVSVADYEAALARVLDRLTARLRAMPVRLAHLGPEAETAAETEAERIVVELAAFDEDVVDEPEPAKAAA
jgi:phage terminase Nu1 subunit (DNA packaging protein)